MLYNYNQALDDLENALNIDPENVLALENRGEVYRCLAMYHRALTDFDKSLEIEPESVFALTQRGRAYNDLSISILEHSHANMKHQKWSNDHIDYIRPVELSDIELLAEGGFGNVYVARWQKGDRNVALKTVHTEWPRAQTLFENEVRLYQKK